MIIRLNEQKFTNRNKIWYRGRGKIDLGFQNWGCIFMTTSIGYAYGYASNDSNGYVEERVLTNTPLNIFNAQNPIDFKLIEKYFPSFENQLKKGDWYEILGEETRTYFLNVLKILKYDGFINFEDEEPPSVSIGIFNPKNTKIVGKLTLENVRNTQEFRKYYMLERKFIYNTFKIHFIENKNFVHFNKKLRIIKEKELKNIFEKLKNSRTFPCSNAKLFIENNSCNVDIL